MNVRNLHHEPTLDPVDTARLSEDGDIGGDAALREARSTLTTMAALAAAVALVAAVVCVVMGRRRRGSHLEHTLLQLPSQGIDALRRGVEHLADLAA